MSNPKTIILILANALAFIPTLPLFIRIYSTILDYKIELGQIGDNVGFFSFVILPYILAVLIPVVVTWLLYTGYYHDLISPWNYVFWIDIFLLTLVWVVSLTIIYFWSTFEVPML
jgi:hypothetical protein